MQEQDLIFYQIYPRSFCDGNGDGEGDIKGIVSKIGYLKDLGINAVWISPCFQSPNIDNGYDISDYRDIDSKAGDLDSFCKMIEKFHESGIKVILDFVANHTSTKHFWFEQSRRAKDNPYRDYYIWKKTPPNDWQSAFGGSAWQFDERTGEYYLHSYAVEQADLNWENPKVREEMKAVADFWISKGVDGFRCDVLDQISKDFQGQNGNGPRLHEFINELFGRKETEGIFTVGECWSTDRENVKLFCGKDRKELTTVFSFRHLCLEKGKFTTEKPSLQEVCQRLAEWQICCQDLDVPNTVFLGNHDQPRAVSRFGNDRKYRYESATMLGAIVLLSRGIPFLYQGEEIGVTNANYTQIEAFNDVETWNYYRANRGRVDEKTLFAQINAGGRDNARRPMPWTGETQGNWWMAEYTRREEVNAEKDLKSEKSVYRVYQKLIELRKTETALREGAFVCKEITENRFVFSRVDERAEITLVCNFEKPSPFDKNKYAGEYLFGNYNEVLPVLQPYQFLILKNTK